MDFLWHQRKHGRERERQIAQLWDGLFGQTWTPRDVSLLTRNGNTHIALACDQERVLAALLICSQPDPEYAPLRVGYLEALAVHPQHRRRKIASRLLEHAIRPLWPLTRIRRFVAWIPEDCLDGLCFFRSLSWFQFDRQARKPLGNDLVAVRYTWQRTDQQAECQEKIRLRRMS